MQGPVRLLGYPVGQLKASIGKHKHQQEKKMTTGKQNKKSAIPTITFNDRIFPVDEDGHLWDINDYGEKWRAYCLHINKSLPPHQKIVACLNEDGSLTKEHYEVIKELRRYYLKNYKRSPFGDIVYRTCNTSPKRFHEFFPSGPHDGACKLAGLPSRRFEHLHWEDKLCQQ